MSVPEVAAAVLAMLALALRAARPRRGPRVVRTAPDGSPPDGHSGSRRRGCSAAGRAERELALLCDLLAAALAAGAPVEAAVETVDTAVTGPRRVRLGELWTAAEQDSRRTENPAARALRRAVSRSEHSGARLAVQLRLLADDLRAEVASDGLDRARRVAVLSVLPLGLCCLPAFMALAVFPLAAGLAGPLLRSIA